ncbi:hypothetical protein T484DRAFT_1615597, partial [Baffinella frigidus]
PNPKPQTPNPKPQTPNPKPQTPNPKPSTPNPLTRRYVRHLDNPEYLWGPGASEEERAQSAEGKVCGPSSTSAFPPNSQAVSPGLYSKNPSTLERERARALRIGGPK